MKRQYLVETNYEKDLRKIAYVLGNFFGGTPIEILYYGPEGHLKFELTELKRDLTFVQLFELSELLDTLKINMCPGGGDYHTSEITWESVRSCKFDCNGVDFTKLLE